MDHEYEIGTQIVLTRYQASEADVKGTMLDKDAPFWKAEDGRLFILQEMDIEKHRKHEELRKEAAASFREQAALLKESEKRLKEERRKAGTPED